jgi:ligand-binding sensor domain-containing protein
VTIKTKKMKRILITLSCILMLFTGNFVNAQFMTTHYYTGNCNLPSDNVLGGVAVDTNNNKWFGTDMGVTRYNGSTWTTFTTADGLPADIISCIAVDKNNNIWIGTDGDGVAKYNGSTWSKYTAADGLCDNGIHYISCDINGDVWFGSWGSGVSKLTGTTWTTFTTGLPMNGVNPAAVNYITVDDLGNKWFGTDAGVAKYNGLSWTTIDQTAMDSLVENNISCIAIDASSNKWIGTLVGITKINSTDNWVKNYRMVDGMYNSAVRDMDFDANGNLWMGLYTDYNNNAGISRYDGSSWVSQQIDFPDSVSADQIFRLAVDKNNDVWVAMDYGILKIDHSSGINENQKISSFNLFPNPANDHITLDVNGAKDKNNNVIEIYNNLHLVKEIHLNEETGTVNISLTDLANGLYFVKVGNNTRKLIICR